MLNMNLQIFAHKKGVGSTKNGRDSESTRLGAKRKDIITPKWCLFKKQSIIRLTALYVGI